MDEKRKVICGACDQEYIYKEQKPCCPHILKQRAKALMGLADQELLERIANLIYSYDDKPSKDESHYRMTNQILILIKEAGWRRVKSEMQETWAKQTEEAQLAQDKP